MIRAGLLYGLAVAAGFLLTAAVVADGCYDTTAPAPPCSVNAHQEGCPPFPTDMRAPDGGAR